MFDAILVFVVELDDLKCEFVDGVMEEADVLCNFLLWRERNYVIWSDITLLVSVRKWEMKGWLLQIEAVTVGGFYTRHLSKPLGLHRTPSLPTNL